MSLLWQELQFADNWWIIAVGSLCAISCGLIGCYLVLQRLSLIGDALSHAVLPGIVLAIVFLGRNPVYVLAGAMLCGILTAFLTQAFQQLGRVPSDSSMGVVFTSLFAIGVILVSQWGHSVDLDPDCILYGTIDIVYMDIVSVAGLEMPRTFRTLAIALILTILFIAFFWKELKICAFDPGLAATIGISVAAMHYALMAMTAMVAVASFEAVGSILVIAMLIVPGATAHLLTDRLWKMMLIAAGVGALSAVSGYCLAVLTDTSSASMMAVAAGAQFLLAVLFAPRHGVISRSLSNLSLQLRILQEDILGELWRRQVEAGAAGAARGDLLPARKLQAARLAMQRLRWSGMVKSDGGVVSLTGRGQKEAGRLIRGHRLWETYSTEELGARGGQAHETAHRVEHFLGEELTERMDESLKTPEKDPHGKEIPRQ